MFTARAAGTAGRSGQLARQLAGKLAGSAAWHARCEPKLRSPTPSGTFLSCRRRQRCSEVSSDRALNIQLRTLSLNPEQVKTLSLTLSLTVAGQGSPGDHLADGAGEGHADASTRVELRAALLRTLGSTGGGASPSGCSRGAGEASVPSRCSSTRRTRAWPSTAARSSCCSQTRRR